MAEDWLADVRKYDANADETVVAKIVRYCGIALRNRDSSLVSFSDPKETARVRQNFLRKKLALTQDDATLDAGIAAVGDRMKADRTKNRVTVYYLLADHFDLLDVFGGAKRGAAATGAAAAAAAVPNAAMGTPVAVKPARAPRATPAPKAASAKRKAPAAPPAPAAATAAPVAVAASGASPTAATSSPAATLASTPPFTTAHKVLPEEGDGIVGFGCLAAAVALGAVLFAAIAGPALVRQAGSGKMSIFATPVASEAAPTPAASPPVAPAPAPAGPEGAGVIGTERDERPMLTVYFDTGKADVAPGFGEAAAPVLAWLESNPDARLAISGFNDPSGNAALNAELSKNRAEAVRAALVGAGVAVVRTDLVKPEVTTTTDLTPTEARRVEVTVVG